MNFLRKNKQRIFTVILSFTLGLAISKKIELTIIILLILMWLINCFVKDN